MTPNSVRVEIVDCGDSAVIVKALSGNPDDAWEMVHNLASAVADSHVVGVHGLVPTYDALLIEFDSSQVDHNAVRGAAELLSSRIVDQPPSREARRRFVIPVVYGGSYGPDLSSVAQHLGISERQVIEQHTAAPLQVRCLGAPAGSPMLDGPAFTRPIPRLASPRTAVPAGSVAVAGRQAVVSPVVSPGGWAVLGRTPLRLIDISIEPPSAYRPGDLFEFREIDATDWDAFAGRLVSAANA